MFSGTVLQQLQNSSVVCFLGERSQIKRTNAGNNNNGTGNVPAEAGYWTNSAVQSITLVPEITFLPQIESSSLTQHTIWPRDIEYWGGEMVSLMNSLQHLFTKGNYAIKMTRMAKRPLRAKVSPVLNMQWNLLEVMRLERNCNIYFGPPCFGNNYCHCITIYLQYISLNYGSSNVLNSNQISKRGKWNSCKG